MNSLTLTIQCHNFQKRLCFMLSSLLDQWKQREYQLTIDIAHLKNNGIPSTEKVIEFFKDKGLNIIDRAYNNIEYFQYRGLTRNDQIKDCKTDFILFSDSDLVYHYKFFYILMRNLTQNEILKNFDGLMCTGRYSQSKEKVGETNKLIDSFVADSPVYVKDVWNIVDKKLEKVGKRNVAAGFFQLINMKLCNHGGYYVNPKKCMDQSWEKGQKALSDIQFKHRIGKRQKLSNWFSAGQIHLNHNRDNENNCHLEEQR